MDAAAIINETETIQGAFTVLTALGLFSNLWPENAVVKDGDKFDFIVVGAGAAGCVIANRLSEDNNINVLLIEAGGNPPIESIRPGLFTYLKGSKVDWNYTSEHDSTAKFHKRNIYELIRGKLLGGSSSMNYMVYTRGGAHDYDYWANVTNDASWSYEQVIPYFIKSEKLLSRKILESKYKKNHGTNGYMKITKPYYDVLCDYLNAFKEAGNDLVIDTNDADSLGYTVSTFNIADGKRQSAALAFLSTAKDRDNLHVLKNALVTKIIIDDNRAIGVEVDLGDQTINLYAEREVIVSAGAINSPQLLMLSGIGPKEHLEKHNINVVKNLPVGRELQDHVLVLMVHRMKRLEKKATASLNPDKFPDPFFVGYGALNKSQGYPDYQDLNFVIQDSRNLLRLCAFYFSYVNELCQELYDKTKGFEVIISHVANLYPKSRGEVLLKSSNPHDYPLVYTNYFSDPEDLENYANYLKHFSKITKTTFFQDVDAELVVPEICGCTRSDARYFQCVLLCLEGTGYHYSGTVSMGRVLNSRLQVYGVESLRVADASVMPRLTGANTHAPTIMIGEKAADFIKEDNGLKKRCNFRGN